MRVIVGVMIKNVIMRARPVNTRLGGKDCVPMAWRTSENTTIMRTNDVMSTIKNGATPNSVRPMRILSGEDPWLAVFARPSRLSTPVTLPLSQAV